MVGGYVLDAEAAGELEGDALDQLAGVDEDEGAAVLLGEGGELVEDLGPHGGGGDGAEFVGGDLDGEVEGAALAYLDDVGRAAAWGPRR